MHISPVPATVEALMELATSGDSTLAETLFHVCDEAEKLVPPLLAVSVTLVDEALTFTSCAEGAAEWVGGHDVRSTLSLPVRDGARLVADIGLYAAATDAFSTNQAQLARVCGADPKGLTVDHDLDFTTRFAAAGAPDRIRDERVVDQAVGVLMSQLGVDDVEAETRLRHAALRAGTSEVQMARAVLCLADLPDD